MQAKKLQAMDLLSPLHYILNAANTKYSPHSQNSLNTSKKLLAMDLYPPFHYILNAAITKYSHHSQNSLNTRGVSDVGFPIFADTDADFAF